MENRSTLDLIAEFRKDRNKKFEEKLIILKQYIDLAKSMDGHQSIVEFYLEKKDASSLRDFFSEEEKASLGITNSFRHENNRYPVRIYLEVFENYLQDRQDKEITDMSKNNDANGINNNNNNTSPSVVQNTNTESIKELLQRVESTIGPIEVESTIRPVEVTSIVPSNMTQPALDGYDPQNETQQSVQTASLYSYDPQYGSEQSDPTSTHLYGYGTQYGTQQSDPTFTETLVENNSFLIDHQQIAFDLGILDEYEKSCLESGPIDSWPQYSARTHNFELYFSTFNNPNQSENQIKSTSHNDDNNNRKKTLSNKKLKDAEHSDYSSDPDKTESDSDKEIKVKRKQEKYRLFHRKKRRSTQTLTISNVSNNESSEIKTGNQSATFGLQKK